MKILWIVSLVICSIFTSPNVNAILPPLQQMRNGIQVQDIKCEKPLLLFFSASQSPVCLTLTTAEDLSHRNWLATNSTLYDDIVLNKTKEFALSSPTFNTFGIKKTLFIDSNFTCDLNFVELCLTQVFFDATHAGYGNGTTSFVSSNQIIHHNIAVRIYDTNQVECAVIDGIWDELNQRPLEKNNPICGWLYGFKGGFP